ncbi:rod shape-determining protein MreC [Croceicoccus sp. F390]|uniref:Cell shape-determining protein MreC n=1 Tax=Croceicoccus esteveae TaxID=3075597 RepID=A0ABU2ZJ23_9SPHN|nr:rod shape-determining protein MreC [Croceicoccus sp. F390]MDT0576610.1 rod shape-determining protein MreC [Croceicoccus sp. F390]
MTVPQHRRPGFSKRAQFEIFTSYVAAVIGAVLGFVLLFVSLVHPASFAFARTAAGDIAEPVGQFSAGSRAAGKSIFATIAGYIDAGSKNAALRKELQLARAQLIEAQAIGEENKRLKQVVRLRETDGQPAAVARLIGSTPSSSRRFALIGVGRTDGIREGQPVRSPVGLVGRVLEVGTNTARVLLVTDAQSIVPVRRANGNVAGFAQGQSDGTLVVRLIEMGINPLRAGDVLVTSGSGGLYRPNVPVAVVRNVTRDGAVARILSDPAASDFVTVEPIWLPITDLPPPPPEPGA